LPNRITLDKGPELAGKALDTYGPSAGVTLEFITPGRPVENAFIEASTAFETECLNENCLRSLSDTQFHIER
jgi:putative transposase